jgi:hypothetical protein
MIANHGADWSQQLTSLRAQLSGPPSTSFDGTAGALLGNKGGGQRKKSE